MLHIIAGAIARRPVVSFDITDIEDIVEAPSAESYVELTNDGTYETSGLVAQGGDWLSPTSAAKANYEARLTVNSGDSPTGASVGSWLSLSTTRRWTLEQTSIGSSTGNYTLEIRRASSGDVLDSATFNMTAIAFEI